MTTPPNTRPNGWRVSAQEFKLPDGRKVIASLPRDLEFLRRKYANQDALQVELVVHGSQQHAELLHRTREHHEKRREEFRQRHGSHFDEWGEVHNQLSSVTTQLRRLSTHTSALSGNFDKFGYDSRLRSYDSHDVESAAAGSASEKDGDAEAAGDRPTETIKLIRKPMLKQWFHRGLIWRASKHTELMALELFFELVYGPLPHT